jgi:uncharacterized membrane protein
MKRKIIGISEGILIAGNSLLLFILLFEHYLSIPLWLQPVGRMHPLMLHFPIGLMLLALSLEFFRFRPNLASQTFYQDFTRLLLLFSILSGLLAALMGVFLSQEDGYSGSVLAWHKWTGAGMVFLASAIYAFRDKSWYQEKVAKIGVVITAITLILAGHFGATLTHGESFILQPVLASKTVSVPFEEAEVFDHLILPVLEKKCNSCHNASKAKGELDMSSITALLKGGKNGAVFPGRNPTESTLFKRIHLPIDDEDHMPPAEKPQLTESEKALLAQWIKSNLDPDTKVATLPATDSLRMLATGFLNSDDDELSFEFASAKPETIHGLNNTYRSVTSFARNSPALDVSFFSPSHFTSPSLEELLTVREQVIHLNLNKMPASDQNLKTVARLENLTRLNLNYTAVTGPGLQELSKLRRLQHLSLSGTKVDIAALKGAGKNFESLRTVTLWETPVSLAEVEILKKEYPNITWISSRPETEADLLQLNLPRLANASNIFQDTLQLRLGHPIRDVEIRFSLDGSEPSRENSPEFIPGETVLSEGKLVKARAYKEGWIPSEVATFDVYKNSFTPDTVMILSSMSQVHPANGSKTFFDKELGTYNANSPAWANNWAGFRRNDMELLLEYGSKVEVSSVSMRVLVEPNNVIFPPQSIEIWGGDEPNSLKLIGKTKPVLPTKGGEPFIELVTCEFKPSEVKFLKVVARPVEKIADWSSQKGNSALLLVDELFVN